ncbi:MAG: hypothetical protein QXP70_04435 [Methanomassiliicoccales archaeon]
MQRKQSGSVRVSYRREADQEIRAQDLSRRELLSYIFEDFLRISYDVLAIFIDALLIPELYLLRPAIGAYGVMHLPGLEHNLYAVYLFCVVLLLEAVAIWLEIAAYRRLWPKYKVVRTKKQTRRG